MTLAGIPTVYARQARCSKRELLRLAPAFRKAAMDRYLPSGFATLAFTAFWRFVASPAEARIRPRKFQVTKDGLIATPYCEGENIARVARAMAFTSPEEVRKNGLKKVYLCQTSVANPDEGVCGVYAPDSTAADLAARA